MKDHCGGLFVVCGIDGSGKTLQSQRLCERLKKGGHQVRYVEFPRYEDGFFGDLIGKYLRGEMVGNAADVSPYLASLPFACDRWELSPRLWEWVDKGCHVVCNRYVTANMAHQGGKIDDGAEREKFFSWVEKMEYEIFAIPRPKVHIWLDIEPEDALNLVTRKGERAYLKGGEDIHENLVHLQAAREAYAEISSRTSNWVTVKCSTGVGPLSPGDVEKAVWEQVVRFL